MSVFWKHDSVGYDGDVLHVHLKVNYWVNAGDFAAELDAQWREARELAVEEHARLMAGVEGESKGDEAK